MPLRHCFPLQFIHRMASLNPRMQIASLRQHEWGLRDGCRRVFAPSSACASPNSRIRQRNNYPTLTCRWLNQLLFMSVWNDPRAPVVYSALYTEHYVIDARTNASKCIRLNSFIIKKNHFSFVASFVASFYLIRPDCCCCCTWLCTQLWLLSSRPPVRMPLCL